MVCGAVTAARRPIFAKEASLSQRCKKLQMLQIYLCYFFSAGANFWAILGHFWAILATLGHFWANLGNFGSFLGYLG